MDAHLRGVALPRGPDHVFAFDAAVPRPGVALWRIRISQIHRSRRATSKDLANREHWRRHKPQLFVQQMREVGGFGFEDIPRTAVCSAQLSADIVPPIYHGSSRTTPLAGKVFALRLPDLIDFKHEKLHFETRETLCRTYNIDATADIVLTGVNHDHRIEPWWTLGEQRTAIIRGQRNLESRL
ncbi:hypothetical protein NKI98_29310 [Mesorhizobium sp. M0222]|uniref:hypothetical protein n=1 Tax=Mesorhizobium sp. M0222 TaxID=2956921 RepID=UPI00333CC97A